MINFRSECDKYYVKQSIVIVIALLLVLGGLFFTNCYAQQKLFEGKKITVMSYAGGTEGPISSALYHWRPTWEEMTGAKLEIIEVPFAQMHEKMFMDLMTKTGSFDGFIVGNWEYGELIANDYISPIDQWFDDTRFPTWPKDGSGAENELHMWEGRWYGALFDMDSQYLYYRYDVLNNPEYQEKFKAEKGYDMPNPPKTLQQLLEVAAFFNGWDWNNDGEADAGTSWALKGGGQGIALHFMPISAQFTVLPGKIDRYHGVYWFDPEDMKPLVNKPGMVEALKYMVKLANTGPQAMKGWDLGEAWDYFLGGKSVFCLSWGDIGPLAQESTSKIKGKLGVTPIPGSEIVYDNSSQRLINLDKPNEVGHCLGGWHLVLSKLSKNPEVFYHLMAYLSSEPITQWCAVTGWDGVDVGRKCQYPPPFGTLPIYEYVKAGWDEGDALRFTGAVNQNYSRLTMWPLLRIPGAWEYFSAFDVYLSEALIERLSPQDAMDKAAKEFEDITNRIGREKQSIIYRRSLGLMP